MDIIKQAAEWAPIVTAPIAFVTASIAVVGGCLALKTYRRNLRLKRAEWMEKLHSKFYESANYKKIRRILDYRATNEYKTLEAASGKENASRLTEAEIELCECLADYLNFFEFIASLWMVGELSLSEIKMLFEYYLRLLDGHDFVMKFISKEGFENLGLLLKEIPGKDKRVGVKK